jgi:hypothetical protein
MAAILKRCSICKRFHAAFLVEEPSGQRLSLCARCWKAYTTSKQPPPTTPAPESSP